MVAAPVAALAARESANLAGIATCPPGVDPHVPAVDPTQLLQHFLEYREGRLLF